MRAFVVVVPVADAELAADHLFQLGAGAIEERSSARSGQVELWTDVGDSAESIATVGASLPDAWTWHTAVVDESVAASWQQFATPTWVRDDLIIVPAWFGGAFDPGAALTITIDPGAAFGMGDHPTTRLTLCSLLDELDARSSPAVLDVGCGSGVLAITAARRGAGRVVAIDIATAALEATRRNSDANGVGGMIDASTTPLADVDESFDIVVANILAPALVAMSSDLRRVVGPGGALVVSGILADRHDHVLDALLPLVPVRSSLSGGWAAVTLSSP